jgi:hypothetical protein
LKLIKKASLKVSSGRLLALRKCSKTGQQSLGEGVSPSTVEELGRFVLGFISPMNLSP